jgi:hypothetical protein
MSEFLQEAKSSVKISTTAKGDPVVEVKVYSGTEDAELDATRRLAIKVYNETVREVRR